MSASLKPGGVVNGQQIFDGSHVLAADFGARQLVNGVDVLLDWSSELVFQNGFATSNINDYLGSGTLTEASGNTITVDWVGKKLQTASNPSVDWGAFRLITNDGSTVVLDWSDPATAIFIANVSATTFSGDGSALTGVSASTVTGVTDGSSAATGIVGEYISASVVQASAVSLTTATPKTVTSISLTAGDWDVTVIGSITGASTGTEFDVAIGTTTNSLTGTVLGDTRCQTPTVSLAGADATLMIPAMRVSISSTTIYYLIVQETFTLGSPKAYGRISARRVR